MLRLNPRQLATFRRTAVSAFEEQMVAHCAAFSPGIEATLGHDQRLALVRAAIARAAGHGLTLKGPVRLFIELGLLFGGDFDREPWAQACLSAEIDPQTPGSLDPTTAQMDRAAALHRAALAALGNEGSNDVEIDR